MDFLKVKIKFRKTQKANSKADSEEIPVTPHPNGDLPAKETEIETELVAEAEAEAEDDEDDDFITNEVKRRLKELRRNSFMVLIPEEDGEEENDGDDVANDVAEEEDGSREWREVEAEARQWWGGFDALYDKYCERMLFFDRMSSQQLNDSGCETPTTPSPRSASKKLRSPLSCLSLKVEEPDDETEHLQQPQSEPYQDIETAYAAQLCLTWEALHCQYTQLTNKIFCRPETPTCYNHSAQLLQQFQVLLQRYIENEPFEQGLRPEIYARARKLWPKLLQVPNIKASDLKETEGEESSLTVLAPDLMKIMESSIVTFHLFLKMGKKKSTGLRNRSGNENMARVHQIQSSLEKKLVKLKEVRKKSRGWKKMSWPAMLEDVQVLFSLIDVEIVSCVVRMSRITNEQLIWCEEKTKKLDLTDGKLRRDPSPLLFPCQ